eukprot:2282949-Ditylum_brightwellii.AAC.1
MRSRETEVKFLDGVPEEDWSVWKDIGVMGENPVDITCIECVGKADVPIADCTYKGSYLNEICKCNKGWMGFQCKTCSLCEIIGVNIENSTLVFAEKLHNQDEKAVKLYGRPL